jgi:NAD(P)H-hydrate repair Nnr-like enzyme with NAD(P)H-hydrate dehydratase domain
MGSNSPEYQLEYRARNPDYMARQRQRQAARTAATRTLVTKHDKEFQRLFAEELAKYNLTP